MIVFVFALLSLIWGSTWLVIKVGLEDLTPFWFATGRFIIAVSPLLLLILLRKRKLPRLQGEWAVIGITGFLIFGVNYALVFWGENYISSGLAAILYTFLPLFGMIFSHFYRRVEQFTLIKMLGILLGIVGVGIIFQHQVHVGQDMAIWGSLAILTASLATAFGGVLIKAHGTHLDTLTLTTGQMVAGLIPLMTLALIFEPLPSLPAIPVRAWLSMVYLGVLGSAVTFLLANWLIKKIPVTTTQLIPFPTTLLAVWLGVLVLGEPLHEGTLLGGTLVLGGMLLATRKHFGLKGQRARIP